MDQRARIPVGPPVNDPLPSYWHNPKSPHARTIEPETSNPSQTYDYAIIGSGISGTMIAHNLLKCHPESRIVMVEAREICSGATGRNGGHTKAASYRSYMHHVQELGKEEALKIARLEYANIVETHGMAKEMGIKCESEMCETVDVIYDKKTFELGKTAIQALRVDARDDEKGDGKMAWYKIHENEEAVRQRFHVADTNGNSTLQHKEEVAGFFVYVAGRIHAYRFTTGVLKHCVQQGLVLCANTPVHAILPSTNSTNTGDSAWDIFTQYTTLQSRHVVLATNGYTPYLLNSLQGAIVPMRGQITAQRPGPRHKLTSPLPTTYSFIYRDGYEYMIPRPLDDGSQHIIIGGGLGRLPAAGASEYGTVDDSSLNSQISTYLNESVVGYFGAENWGEGSEDDKSQRMVQEWTGIMGATADGRPFVGEVPGKKGMWISAGFNGHGMVLCLKSAQGLVEMMQGKGRPEWFAESFLITEERIQTARFVGRRDVQVRCSS
ncbi:FAD dependent oxidoreductase [Phaeosphaeria sp. MPI-PUGE-AT-0046c]|nr:FAD dependent oxidoreductase [Phaeosphaeria sp. MPI-PUGE-AT-0046c]